MLKSLVVQNVCQALPLGVDLLKRDGQSQSSRAGDVLVCSGPVVTQYIKPWQRVLFNNVRDANPFFHLAEAMWMLAGRNDADFINQFVHDFGLRFAEDGVLWASYGYRWRSHFGKDQLDYIVQRLKNDPNDRRIVLSMWDGQCDLFGNEFAASHLEIDGRKDIPCNTHAYFRVRKEEGEPEPYGGMPLVRRVLDMTVCCRSNDIIWGAYGANAVHFSFLQEYLAAMLGVNEGSYYQFSNNYHAYQSELDRLSDRSGLELFYALQDNRYGENLLCVPLVQHPECFDDELRYALDHPYEEIISYQNNFITDVFSPAMKAHRAYKNGFCACEDLSRILADDWRIACTEWIERRLLTKKSTSPATHEEVVG
jgi:hypothetical protein